ncbi:MAG: extensin family protein [Pseudomonadota bacterium]
MKRHLPHLIVSVIALTLAACGGSAESETRSQPYFVATSADWRGTTEAMCVRETQPDRYASVTPLAPISERGACGARQPFDMAATFNGGISLSPSATMRCSMVNATDEWLNGIVQNAARQHFRERVTSVRVAASYACRPRNNQRGAKLSEHGYANALDISAFTFENGETVTVTEGWNGSRKERRFLRAVHEGACEIFSTVIGPDGDAAHRTHFHVDLARHGRAGTYKYCR